MTPAPLNQLKDLARIRLFKEAQFDFIVNGDHKARFFFHALPVAFPRNIISNNDADKWLNRSDQNNSRIKGNMGDYNMPVQYIGKQAGYLDNIYIIFAPFNDMPRLSGRTP
jgi:hypothetical protein